MNRRNFLRSLLGAVGTALVPWRLPPLDAADVVLTTVSDEPFENVILLGDYWDGISIEWDKSAKRILEL